MIIAIDGPAASGKSTVAKAVAARLGIRHLDTGAMYRAVAWLALEEGIPLDDGVALAALAQAHPVSFQYANGGSLATAVIIADTNVITAIRQPEVDAAVSPVSAVPAVREALVERQRELAGESDTVVEGRDIGTVVFPSAEVKVFLTASAAERARRRAIDMHRLGHDVAEEDVRSSIERRDRYDSTREASPLAPAADAELLDTTGLSVEQVVDEIVARFEAAR